VNNNNLWSFGADMEFFCVNSHACVCVLNNILLTCNNDYNINNHFEKLTHNSLTFNYLTH